MESIKAQLLEMGFEASKVKRALESCPEAQTVDQVMEWILAHQDEFNSEPQTGQAGNSTTTTAAATSAVSADKDGDDAAQKMADSKKITVQEAQRIIAERLVKRAEEERKKQIEDEKKRRFNGQKMAETRAELQDQERIRLAQQIRKEKIEKELYKKQLMEQIARDREANRNRNKPAESTPAAAASTSSSATSKPATSSSTGTKANECRLALRFPDGSSMIHKFSPQEQLSAVRLLVQTEKKVDSMVEFVAPPNQKLDQSMMNDTLESLGLCPATRLEVKFKQADPWTDMD